MQTDQTNKKQQYKCGPGFGSRGERAYALRVQGKSWDDIAEILRPPSLDVTGGDPASAVANVAKKFAKSRGLEWPVVVPEVPRAAEASDTEDAPSALDTARAQQKLAYDLRASGLPWAEVTKLTTYSQVPHAVAGAAKYASREGLAWPIDLG